MDSQSFQHLLTELEALTEAQCGLVLERIQKLEAEVTSKRLIEERLTQSPQCPHCQQTRIVRFGETPTGQQRFRCNDCRRTFTALTGTPFNFLHDKDKLLLHAACMSEGLSIRKTAKTVELTVDRAFRWRHRMLDFLAGQKPTGLTGVVEADETMFRRSYKGQRQNMPRAAKKRARPGKDVEDERVPVVIAMQRGSRLTHDCILENGTAACMTAALKPALSSDAVLSTDGNPTYGVTAQQLAIQSGYFVASYDGPGGYDMWHVQNVNAYDSRLKGWMLRFHGVATKYLHNYLGWRRLLDRFKDAVTSQQFLFHALRQGFINM